MYKKIREKKCHLKENNEFECNDDLHLTSRERDETQRNVCINDSQLILLKMLKIYKRENSLFYIIKILHKIS